ncbi:hypothetical protein RN001_002633 [Aquatica leii]|uniref:Uncharacterized protein n=1 Tax=Aquatica leii TaxID=1421715 RepID=A0AAN7PH63_9COLE|nr:hypothetical protein RN001_002633 [Aquatica leii]
MEEDTEEYLLGPLLGPVSPEYEVIDENEEVEKTPDDEHEEENSTEREPEASQGRRHQIIITDESQDYGNYLNELSAPDLDVEALEVVKDMLHNFSSKAFVVAKPLFKTWYKHSSIIHLENSIPKPTKNKRKHLVPILDTRHDHHSQYDCLSKTRW